LTPSVLAVRLTVTIGGVRVRERERASAGWERSPLVEKLAAPRGVKTPAVVAISCDGGRLQRCDVPATSTSHWREYKAGVLLELDSFPHAEDPCPAVPTTFFEPAHVAALARDIGLCAARDEVDGAAECENGPPPAGSVYHAPGVVSRDVVATLTDSTRFGKQLAARAWDLGFAQSRRKAFVADGGTWNWSIWADQFRHQGYVPILDFVHALTYVFAAATAGRARAIGWSVYQRWITHLWQGQVVQVISELAHRQQELGPPPDDAPETDPRCVVRDALTYLQNQQSRMDYPRYRQLGLPITSSHIESTIKELNSRVKGSEKFWSSRGGEAVLQLRADYLCDSQPLALFWPQRAHQATGTRTYAKAA
jgi:hypothetical protein